MVKSSQESQDSKRDDNSPYGRVLYKGNWSKQLVDYVRDSWDLSLALERNNNRLRPVSWENMLSPDSVVKKQEVEK